MPFTIPRSRRVGLPTDLRQLSDKHLHARLLALAGHDLVEFGIGVQPNRIAPGDEGLCLGRPLRIGAGDVRRGRPATGQTKRKIQPAILC